MNTNTSQHLPSSWARLKVASTLAGTVLIPLVIAYASNEYTNAIKQNEIGQRYVELAVGILSKPPAESTMETRKWAVKVVNHYSEVRMPDVTQEELIKNQLKAIEEVTKTIQEMMKTIPSL